MNRSSIALIVLLAALTLTATRGSGRDAGGDGRGPGPPGLPGVLAAQFPGSEVRMPFSTPELVDPRGVYPDVSGYPIGELTAVFRYSRSCAEEDLLEVRHPTLVKARDWHRFLCGPEGGLPARFFEDGPRFHPGGGSFVALAAASGLERFGPAWLREHAHGLHVLETGILLDAGLEVSPERLMLYGLAPAQLRRLVDRSSLVVGTDSVFLLDSSHGAGDPGAYRAYPRERYEVARQASQTRPRPEWAWLAVAAGAVLLGVVVVQGVRRVRFRRMLMHERARVLRTLAHEVRTPTSSLKLVLEELRDDYDELPASAQKNFLALCDDVSRLERVIRESGRYLGAFRRSPGTAYRRTSIASVNAFIAGVLEPYGDRLTFEPLDGDPGVVTDPYWFAVCIRNLVDNALTHGAPPVVVRLHADRRRLHLTVRDGGAVPARELQRGLRPFLRTDASPGLGLGLAIVADTVAGLRGKLTWSARPTRFTMSLRRHG